MKCPSIILAAALSAAAFSASAGKPIPGLDNPIHVFETNTVEDVDYETELTYRLDFNTDTAVLERVYPVIGEYKLKNNLVVTYNSHGLDISRVFVVTKLADFALADNPGLLKCTITSSILDVGACVFSNCTALAEVELAYGVRSIGERAFINTAVKAIALPDSVIEIGGNLNAGTLFTSEISISDSSHFVYDDYGVLYNRDKTKLYACPTRAEGTVSIPASVTDIAADAFFGCHRLTYLNFPATLKTIGDAAFNVSGIWTSLAAPESTPHLKSLFFNGPVPDAADDIFLGAPDDLVCYALDESWDGVTTWKGREVMPLSDGTNPPVLSYTDSAGIKWSYRIVRNEVEIFNKDSNGQPTTAVSPASTSGVPYKETEDSLEVRYALKIPNAINGFPVTRIGANAFEGCASVTCIGIPSSVREIGDRAFKGCTALKSIDAADNVPFASETNKISLPVGITTLGVHPFEGMNAASVSLPYTLTEACGNPVAGCPFVTTLTVDASCPSFSSDGNVLYDRRKATVVAVPANFDGSSVSFADTVTKIGDEALHGCKNLVTVQLPESLETIGVNALSGCSSVKSLTLHSGLAEICSGAFADCSALETVTFDGDAPTAADDIYDGTPETLTSYVSSEAAGFNETTWKGRPIVVRSGEDPELDVPDVTNQKYTDDAGVTWTYNGYSDGTAKITGAEGDVEGKTVTIPKTLDLYTLSDLSTTALDNLTGVKAYASSSGRYKAKNGCLYSANGKTLVRVPDGIALPYYMTTDVTSNIVTVTIIPDIKDSGNPGNDATTVSTNIQTVASTSTVKKVDGDISFDVLLDGVTAIAEHAFYGCNAGLTDESEHASEMISGETGFIGSSGDPYIRTVTAESTVTTAYKTVFAIPSTVTSVSDNAFEGGDVEVGAAPKPKESKSGSASGSGNGGSNVVALQANTSYIGWLEDNGTIVGTVTAKASNARNGVVKVSGTVIKIGQKKARITSEAALKAIGGLTLVKDLSKSKSASEKAAFDAFKGKCWTLAYDTSSTNPLLGGCTTLSVSVGAKGKVRVKGYAADGTKITGTAQMVKDGDQYKIPLAVQTHAGKLGGIALCLNVKPDGSISTQSTATLKAVVNKKSSTANLTLVRAAIRGANPGVAIIDSEDAEKAGYTIDPTLKGWKPRYTKSTGEIKGSVYLYRTSDGKRFKAKVYGVAVGDTGYATMVIKNTASYAATIAK